MAAHLSEEEQLDAIKRWWKQYGTTLMVALVVVAVGFFSWNQYKKHQQRQAHEASNAYTQMMESEGEAEVAQTLINEFGDTLYADFARLEQARLAVEGGDLESARQRLQEVVNDAANSQLQPLARLRLVKVLAAQGQFDQALEQLEGDVPGAFASAYAEAKGDVYMMQSRLPEARTAYESALTALTDPRSLRRGLVQLKLENTRVADGASSQEPAAQPAAAPAEEG